MWHRSGSLRRSYWPAYRCHRPSLPFCSLPPPAARRSAGWLSPLPCLLCCPSRTVGLGGGPAAAQGPAHRAIAVIGFKVAWLRTRSLLVSSSWQVHAGVPAAERSTHAVGVFVLELLLLVLVHDYHQLVRAGPSLHGEVGRKTIGTVGAVAAWALNQVWTSTSLPSMDAQSLLPPLQGYTCTPDPAR